MADECLWDMQWRHGRYAGSLIMTLSSVHVLKTWGIFDVWWPWIQKISSRRVHKLQLVCDLLLANQWFGGGSTIRIRVYTLYTAHYHNLEANRDEFETSMSVAGDILTANQGVIECSKDLRCKNTSSIHTRVNLKSACCQWGWTDQDGTSYSVLLVVTGQLWDRWGLISLACAYSDIDNHVSDKIEGPICVDTLSTTWIDPIR